MSQHKLSPKEALYTTNREIAKKQLEVDTLDKEIEELMSQFRKTLPRSKEAMQLREQVFHRAKRWLIVQEELTALLKKPIKLDRQ